MKIGYQGIKGAYSEAAVYKHYGKKVEAIGFETFEDVFEAVKKNKIDHGFLPFEWSKIERFAHDDSDVVSSKNAIRRLMGNVSDEGRRECVLREGL